MKKSNNKIFVLALSTSILFSTNSYSQDENCNIGNDEKITGFNESSLSGNILQGNKHTLSEEGTLRAINMIGNNTGGNIKMAVYDDNAGTPNNLIESGSGTVGNGETSIPVTPTLLPEGDYWILAVYESRASHSFVNLGDLTTAIDAVEYAFTYDSAFPDSLSSLTSKASITLNHLHFLSIDCGDTLSIDTFEASRHISLYPNPTDSFITLSNLQHSTKYVIINPLGQEIMSGNIANEEQINIQNLAKGLYFLQLDGGGGGIPS